MTSTALEAYLSRLERELQQQGLQDRRIVDEAREHLVDAVEDGLQHGLSVEAAESQALVRFGSPEISGKPELAESRRSSFLRVIEGPGVAHQRCRTSILSLVRRLVLSILIASAVISLPAQTRITSPKEYLGFNVGDDYQLANYTQLAQYWKKLDAETQNINRVLYRDWLPQILYNHHQSGPAGTVAWSSPQRDPYNFNLDPLLILGLQALGTHMHQRLPPRTNRA